MIEKLFRQPEYIHVLINPLPIYGLAIAFIGLTIAIFMRNRGAQIATLVLVVVCSASAWPVAELGDQAKDRVLSMENEAGQAWIEEHEHRADQCVPFFYALAVLALIAIVAPMKWPRSSLPLAVTVAIFSVVVLGMGGYIAHAGGKIRHHEFRTGPPPAKRD